MPGASPGDKAIASSLDTELPFPVTAGESPLAVRVTENELFPGLQPQTSGPLSQPGAQPVMDSSEGGDQSEPGAVPVTEIGAATSIMDASEVSRTPSVPNIAMDNLQRFQQQSQMQQPQVSGIPQQPLPQQPLPQQPLPQQSLQTLSHVQPSIGNQYSQSTQPLSYPPSTVQAQSPSFPYGRLTPTTQHIGIPQQPQQTRFQMSQRPPSVVPQRPMQQSLQPSPGTMPQHQMSGMHPSTGNMYQQPQRQVPSSGYGMNQTGMNQTGMVQAGMGQTGMGQPGMGQAAPQMQQVMYGGGLGGRYPMQSQQGLQPYQQQYRHN